MIRSYLRRIGIGIEDRKHKVHRGSTYHRPRHSIISGNGEMAGIGNSREMAGRASSRKAVKGSYTSTYAFPNQESRTAGVSAGSDLRNGGKTRRNGGKTYCAFAC